MEIFANDPFLEEGMCNAPIGTFDKHYRLSRNFIADLVHLGPILVSVAVEKDFSRALVRSVLGFKEYRFYSKHIEECPYFFTVRNSLSRYFVDTIDNWRHVEIAPEQRESSLMGILGSIFSFGAWPLRDESGGGRKKMYDAISSGMMGCPERYSAKEIMNKMAEVRVEYARGVDNEFYTKPIYVDLVCESSKRIPREMLGKRFIDPEDTLSVSSDDLEDIKSPTHSGEKRLRQALLGFLFNEVEYFCQVNGFYLDIVSKARKSEINFEDVFKGFYKVHSFEAGFIESMRDIVEEAGFKMDRILSDPQYFADTMRDNGVGEIKMDDEEILEKVLDSFERHLNGFRCYEDMMLFHEEYIETLEKVRSYDWAPDYRVVNDCFCNCLQRIVRYPILIDDILQNLTFSLHEKRVKKIYAKMTKLINIIDKKKERHDNIRCEQLIREKVEEIPGEVAERKANFLFQLNCEDSNGDPIALFLFREMVIIADREGPSLPIQDPRCGRYFFRHSLRLEDIEIVSFGTTGIKIIGKGSLKGNEMYEMKEVYSDVSIGVMYFSKGSPHSVKWFIEEYHKAGTDSGNGLYASGNVFFRVLKDSEEGGQERKRDLIIYVGDVGLDISSDSNSAHLDLENGAFTTKGQSIQHSINYGKDEIKQKFGEIVGNGVRARKAWMASKDTPGKCPELFAMYRIKLREIVEECGDSSVVEFNGRFSKCNSSTITRKIRVAEGIIRYLSRSLPYVGCRSSGGKYLFSSAGLDRSRLKEEEMVNFLEKALSTEELEDYAFSEYNAEDILYLLMYFIRTSMYTFFRIEDIETLHRTLFVDKIHFLGAVVPKMSNPSFVSSLFETIVTARDKLCIVPTLDMFLVMFSPFQVSEQEMAEIVTKICW
ncbi:uncharacterized protein Eint_101100 [Encephalitozoon intestinalis ATCC 50506]|uniref:DH domain-containing protein n=1 Tax=Encephalitozoon intestinalis (strain ATCC 50506) TaxID=876142 RepID=E0S9Q0_ENCIT|nr:uncharacterized protein Eint_101100 [Encephalitozoon intestinalis ATCC 50506]ADM12435.1 hypothetical protein Eint_101100 [Encephalitozoon intestinalis ATCC 50506]UTX46270.1 hypothetical protein GPK93_10g18700 [Encephalitozoon intestinalis]